MLVCDGHGVACFKPEKKAKWKHVNVCSLFVQEKKKKKVYFFLPFHRSASESELKAARVTT